MEIFEETITEDCLLVELEADTASFAQIKAKLGLSQSTRRFEIARGDGFRSCTDSVCISPASIEVGKLLKSICSDGKGATTITSRDLSSAYVGCSMCSLVEYNREPERASDSVQGSIPLRR